MRHSGGVLAALIVVLLVMPNPLRAESIYDAGMREAARVRLSQIPTAPVFWRSTRAARLVPIVVGATVGCAAFGTFGYAIGAEYHEEFKGLFGGCAGGALFGAVIGYVVSAR